MGKDQSITGTYANNSKQTDSWSMIGETKTDQQIPVNEVTKLIGLICHTLPYTTPIKFK